MKRLFVVFVLSLVFSRSAQSTKPLVLPLEVIADARTGEKFTSDLEGAGFAVGFHAKWALRSGKLVSPKGVVYELVIIKGSEFSDSARTNENVWALAARRGYKKPPPAVAPLLREKLSNRDLARLGFDDLVVMHEPIVPRGRIPILLGLCRHFLYDDFVGYDGDPQASAERDTGFVFLASKK